MDRIWTRHYDPSFKPSVTYPEKTMYALVRDRAEQNPQRVALSFMGRQTTYGDLLARIDKLAARLAGLGMARGAVATLCLPNMPDGVVALYAVNKLGAIANMVHPLTPPQELRHYIQFTDSDYLFVLDAFLPKYVTLLAQSRIRKVIVSTISDSLPPWKAAGFWLQSGRKIPRVPVSERIVRWRELMKEPSDRALSGQTEIETAQDARAPAVYLHSGGTTGSPKTIVLSSYNFNALAVQGPQIIGFNLDTFDPATADISMVSILPMFHGFGLCMGIHAILANGMRSILVPQFSPDILAKVIQKEKPAMIAAVPTLLEGIMKSKRLANADLSCLRAVFCGGDSLPAELKTRFDAFVRARHGDCQVREGYGLTETVTVCAVNPIHANRAGTVGVPLSDIDMKVVEPDTENEVPIGQDGEFCVAGPTVMMAYLHDAEATAGTVRVHADGQRWVHTGDFGCVDADGFFHFKQRIKRILKVSGIPVFPSQIEDVLAQVPGIREACVIGVPHPYKMQEVKAFVVRADDSPGEDELRQAIVRHCREHVIPYAVPAEIEFRAGLPRTKVGKIDFVALEREELIKRQ